MSNCRIVARFIATAVFLASWGALAAEPAPSKPAEAAQTDQAATAPAAQPVAPGAQPPAEPAVPETAKAAQPDTTSNAQPPTKAAQVQRTAQTPCVAAPVPIYVEDWGRLAALTESDADVFGKADYWRQRDETASWVVGIGGFLGLGAAALGLADRLTNDSWSDSSRWSIGLGLSTALMAILLDWTMRPDRDDRLTVINHWNLRHRDRPLAP